MLYIRILSINISYQVPWETSALSEQFYRELSTATSDTEARAVILRRNVVCEECLFKIT